ncbi:MAG: hypothetical protein ACE5HQ_00335 [Gemmatimonadota bacterium]
MAARAPANPRPPRVAAFPERLLAPEGEALPVFECNRTCLLDSSALSLLDLLLEAAPGLTPLRTGYFGGSHHVLEGPFGPGSVLVFLDGNELPPLESGQVDLERISVVYLDRVRVFRRADGVVIDLASRRHDEPVAYARITGATGDPNLQLLRAIFANGLGRDFTITSAFDLLNVFEPERENDRFDFFARMSYMPMTNRFGAQLEYRSESLSRTSSDTLDLDRRTLLLRLRGDLSSTVQAEAVVSSSDFRVDSVKIHDVNQATLTLSARPGRTALVVGLQFQDGAAYPSVVGRARATYSVSERLIVQAGAEIGSWDEFTSREFRVGASYKLNAPLPITLRADGVAGRRGISRPANTLVDSTLVGTADSVSFSAAAASVEAELGKLRLRGRLSLQSLDRQLPFGDTFDRDLTPLPSVDVVGLEAGIRGPLIPLSFLHRELDPITVDAFWRHQSTSGNGTALYLPANLYRARLIAKETFFQGNLTVWLSGTVSHRDQTASARAGDMNPVLLPSYNWFSGRFGFQIGEFHFWLRFTNPNGFAAAEVPGISFPRRVTVFGVKWEFFN